jgi:5-methylthioadenosine/S-adenosylhomocysteine deaminase
LIADRGAAVGMVPDMELLLGLVQFNVAEYLKYGAKVGIGLDGPVVAYGHSLWNAMKSVIIGQRLNDGHRKLVGGDGDWDNTLVFGSAELALELATIRGAQALRMDDRIGSLEVGKEADVVVIDTSDQTTLSTRAALIPNLVYSGGPDPHSIARVMVHGRTICERGVIGGLDPHVVVRRADQLQQELLDETGCAPFVRKATPWTWHSAHV